ncbi:hypothetical protein EDC01DRAFT_679453 [Geopyxis carbonaria]|nr:hypothetical protein EDC01DRAFT_679453 [Geopyxis carbonaria]
MPGAILIIPTVLVFSGATGRWARNSITQPTSIPSKNAWLLVLRRPTLTFHREKRNGYQFCKDIILSFLVISPNFRVRDWWLVAPIDCASLNGGGENRVTVDC